MKQLILISLVLLAIGCKKKEVIPPPKEETMKYLDLKNQVVRVGERVMLDINNDGIRDFRFGEWEYASPGDNAMKQEFFVFTYDDAYSPTDDAEFSMVMEKDQVITIADPEGYQWANVSQMVLVRNTKHSGTGVHTWTGPWKNVQHRYLPILITIQNKRHAGWIELSMDIETPKLTLHRAAWSIQPEKDIPAGR
ncbi:MAG: hypothetical protein KIT80_12885 [Chitinophagaceae bacterium]|nr:hypothetical protein [Chitinophagaceae bacterium]MCW5927801.1 hypothetical protein [Chitinophagaceae bacterium]